MAIQEIPGTGVGCVGGGHKNHLALEGQVGGFEVPVLYATGINASCVWDPSDPTPSPLRGRGFLKKYHFIIILLLIFKHYHFIITFILN